jgi:hypothetical protein
VWASGTDPAGRIDPNAVLSDASKAPTQKFSTLREVRRNVVKAIDDLDQRYRDLVIILQRGVVTYPIIRPPLNQDKKSIQNDIEKLTKNRDGLKSIIKTAKSASQKEILASKLSDIEQQLADKHSDLEQFGVQLAAYQKTADEEDQRYKATEKDYNRKVKEASVIDDQLTDLINYLGRVDDAVTGLLLSTDTNNTFKIDVTIAFSILVGLVISGFFFLLAREKEIRAKIFENDAGLQFVTLFALIIAIILFGVINILEGKELAALLGGLSGYILGRGGLGSGPRSTSPNTSNTGGS